MPVQLRHLLIATGIGVVLFGVTEGLSEYRNTQVADIALNFCAVASLTVLTGWSGQISLGNGGFIFVGAFTTAVLLEHHPLANSANGYNNIGLAFVLMASIAVAAILGAVIGVCSARLPRVGLAVATLALALALPAIPSLSFVSAHLGGHSELIANVPSAPDGVDFARWQAWICCLAAVLTGFLLASLTTSRLGGQSHIVGRRSVSNLLQAAGPGARGRAVAVTVSAAAAGLAGGLYAMVNGQVVPGSFPLSFSLILLAGAVFGGLESLAGAFYGAVLVTLLPLWTTDVATRVSVPIMIYEHLSFIVAVLALVIAVLLLPWGIHGWLRRAWSVVTTTDGHGAQLQ